MPQKCTTSREELLAVLLKTQPRFGWLTDGNETLKAVLYNFFCREAIEKDTDNDKRVGVATSDTDH